MKPAAKIISILIGIFITLNGLMFMFKPEYVMEHAQIQASTAFGLSTVRGIIGGSMIAVGFLTIIAVLKSRLEFLHPVAIVLIAWTLGRIVSLILDGFNKDVLVSGIFLSLVMAILITASHKILTK